MNAAFAGIVLASILIFATVPNVSAETEGEKYSAVVNFFGSITNTYAYLGDTAKIQNSNRPSGPAGDMVTSSGGLFTVYMIAQGWPAVMCKPGENPNVVGKCFVDEGVNLTNTLIYSAGVKDVDSDTSASFGVREKRIAFDNTSRMTTLSLNAYVDWTRTVCTSSSGDGKDAGTIEGGSNTGNFFTRSYDSARLNVHKYKVLRFEDSDSSSSSDSDDSEGGSSSRCSTSNGTWNGWLSQTIPTPQEFKYNKTQNMTYVNSPLVKLVNTTLTQEEFGFGMEGYTPSYSRSNILESILLKNTTPNNESVNITLSYYEDYYKIAWDEKRQIYYGELINVSAPPRIEVNRARLFYDYSNKTVSSIQTDNGTVLKEFWIMSPFGKKNVTVMILEAKQIDIVGESVVLISFILTLILLFYAAKPLITGR